MIGLAQPFQRLIKKYSKVVKGNKKKKIEKLNEDESESS